MIRHFCDRCGCEYKPNYREYKADYIVSVSKYSWLSCNESMGLCDDCLANRDIMLKAFLDNKTIEFEE